MRALLLFLSCYGLLLGYNSEKAHALYLLHNGKIKESIEKYEQICAEEGRQDFALLQDMALTIMKKGAKSENPEKKLLTFYGAGLAMNQASIDILSGGIRSKDPRLQSLSLYFLSQISDSRSDALIVDALSSEFLQTRMEACFLLAQKKHEHAMAHLESLMQKLPPFFTPFFPQFFALLGTSEAMTMMKRFLDDRNPLVRIEAIYNLLQHRRDDFIGTLLHKLPHATIGEQEAIIWALGQFKDSSSLAILHKYKKSTVPSVQLAAYKSLYMLGDMKAKDHLEKSALAEDVYAIFSLGEIPGSEESLYFLLFSTNEQIRVNAALALLSRKDPRCQEELTRLLLSKNLFIRPSLSVGKAHMAFKVHSTLIARNKEEEGYLQEMSLQIKEQMLRESLHLGEKTFLHIAEAIFNANQNDLVPQTIHMLENLQTDEAIALLKKLRQKVGSPLIRCYAHLALFRLGEEGPYERYLINWIKKEQQNQLIRLRPHLPIQERINISRYSLSAEETSRLLVEIFTAFAQKREIAPVLETLKNGHPFNRYALAGLLLRAME